MGEDRRGGLLVEGQGVGRHPPRRPRLRRQRRRHRAHPLQRLVIPFACSTKSLGESRLALVTTGGVHPPGQPRFDIDDPAGDCSYREIPTSARELTWTHAYHRPDEGSDLDSVFPLWTLRELASEGLIGGLNPRHFSFMGAIHDTQPLSERTAPEVAARLVEDGADAVLLTPS
ncbi:hypothetical protein GBA63_14520 [Rubrobacter tropicus]|uniref:Selenoprotein B glycine/betaine/sarcosine/D-proline reductase n=1 Tax=Rubrobacter tropicus TaxID=2653851 RepID=A0A6G8QFH7_9ACTN|nr:hypothetical protein GBA63_14520 [Rubrobacter tropicus]